eukprot:546426_1
MMKSKIPEAHALLALIGIFLDTFIYCPLILHWSLNIWKLRHSLIIRKRHSRIIITIGIVSCLYYLIQRNIGFLIYSELLSDDHTLRLTSLNCYLYPIFNYGLFYIMVYRYWLLYFKTKFAAAQSNGEWQMIINPHHGQNWWILNKKRFGSGHFLRKYIILLWLCIVCGEGTLWLYSLTYPALIMDFLIILFPFILTIYIRQNLPLLIDKLRIKQELKYIFLIIMLAFIVIALLSSAIAVLSYFGVAYIVYISRSLYNTVSLISTFGTFLCVYIQTQWVINKFRTHLHYYSSRHAIKLKTTLTQQMILTKKEKKENSDKISISDVLTHEDAFYVFMNHLIAEHSSECLLSLVEMVQYKESILDNINLIKPKRDAQEEEEEEEVEMTPMTGGSGKRSSEVERNIKALSLALSGGAVRTSIVDDNSMLFGVGTPKTKSIPLSVVPLTTNGLIALPPNVPKSAIIFNNKLDILMDIPGVEVAPGRKRRITIDNDVINESRAINVSQHDNESVVWNKSVIKKTENELIEEYKIRAYMLYCKYIASDSELEINIDYATRNKLIQRMNDINQWLRNKDVTLDGLSVLFDVCIQQMYTMCKFSMGRFKQSDDFHTLVTCFGIKQIVAQTSSPRTP